MNLNDLPPGYDDPLDALLGFHRRIERQLASLARLPWHLEVYGVDAEASAAAAGLVEFFCNSLHMHHRDEDELLRMLEMRIAERAERDDFRDHRQMLESEHRVMDRDWRGLRRPLEGIAEGLQRRVPADLVRYFRAMHAMHISSEEAGLHLSAARRLLPEDRAALGRGMAARRTRNYRFQ